MFIDDQLRTSKQFEMQIKKDFKMLKHLGIDDIAAYRINKNAEITWFASNIEFSEEYWDSELYKYTNIAFSPVIMGKDQYIFTSDQLIQYQHQKVSAYLERTGLVNSIHIIEKINNDLYGYAFNSRSHPLHPIKITNLLTSFIQAKRHKFNLYFDQSSPANMDKLMGIKFYHSPIITPENKPCQLPHSQLTERQIAFAQQFNQTVSCKELAYNMNLTERTIQNYVTDLKSTLELNSIYELRDYLKTTLTA